MPVDRVVAEHELLARSRGWSCPSRRAARPRARARSALAPAAVRADDPRAPAALARRASRARRRDAGRRRTAPRREPAQRGVGGRGTGLRRSGRARHPPRRAPPPPRRAAWRPRSASRPTRRRAARSDRPHRRSPTPLTTSNASSSSARPVAFARGEQDVREIVGRRATAGCVAELAPHRSSPARRTRTRRRARPPRARARPGRCTRCGAWRRRRSPRAIAELAKRFRAAVASDPDRHRVDVQRPGERQPRRRPPAPPPGTRPRQALLGIVVALVEGEQRRRPEPARAPPPAMSSPAGRERALHPLPSLAHVARLPQGGQRSAARSTPAPGASRTAPRARARKLSSSHSSPSSCSREPCSAN